MSKFYVGPPRQSGAEFDPPVALLPHHVDMVDVGLSRARRKIERRDKRIAALLERVAALESALSRKTAVNVTKEVEAAVYNALRNVRMIPVFPLGDDKIVEVKVSDTNLTRKDFYGAR